MLPARVLDRYSALQRRTAKITRPVQPSIPIQVPVDIEPIIEAPVYVPPEQPKVEKPKKVVKQILYEEQPKRKVGRPKKENEVDNTPVELCKAQTQRKERCKNIARFEGLCKRHHELKQLEQKEAAPAQARESNVKVDAAETVDLVLSDKPALDEADIPSSPLANS
jgi:hypothetical protein